MQVTAYRAQRFTPAKVLSFPADLVRNWFVISSLVRRELKGRYLNSAFGALWTIINPLFMLVVYTTVFAGILKVRWAAKGIPVDSPATFALMLYAAITPWMAFAESVTRGTSVVIENANLIKKVAFPSESLPVYIVVYTFVNELIGIAILVVALPFFPGFHLHAAIVWYPVIALLRMLFTLGVVYLVAAANVFIRDVGQMIGLLLQLWMFLTPIFYAKEMLEDSGVQWVQGGMRFNPWYYIVNMYRDIFLRGVAPDPRALAITLVVGLVTFVIGYSVFLTSKSKFSDEI